MARWTMNMASPKLWPRLLVAAGVVLITLAWTGILAAISDLPEGYGSAQSRDERWLKGHSSAWETYRRGANHDLTRYIPGYVALGIVLIGAIVLVRRRRAGPVVAPGDHAPVIIAGVALVVGAVGDIVETLLFRQSLTRLIETAGAGGVATLASITKVMTALKWIGLGVCFATILVLVLRRPQTEKRDGTCRGRRPAVPAARVASRLRRRRQRGGATDPRVVASWL